MGDYLTINEAVAEASKSAGCVLTQVPGKKIMFHGRMRNGESVIMCTPQAKRQPQGFYWTDITEVQYNLLNSYDNATVVFRLEGNHLVMWDWRGLKNSLTKNCMKYNAKEGNHWKLYIYDDRVKIVGNPQEVKIGAPITKIWDKYFKK